MYIYKYERGDYVDLFYDKWLDVNLRLYKWF